MFACTAYPITAVCSEGPGKQPSCGRHCWGHQGLAPALAELKVWENYSVGDLLAMFLASENFRRIPPRLMVGQITLKIGKKIFPIGKLEGIKMNLKALSLRQDGAQT